MLESLKEWSPIIISLLTLIAGSGWIKYLLKRKEAKRKEWNSLLQSFLLPLERILLDNKEIHEELGLRRLELHPLALQKHFNDPSSSNSIRITWLERIKLIQSNNARAEQLIDANIGKSTSPQFKKACNDFKRHSQNWQVLWNAVINKDPMVNSKGLDVTSEKLYAPPFPQGIEKVIEDEIALVRKHVK